MWCRISLCASLLIITLLQSGGYSYNICNDGGAITVPRCDHNASKADLCRERRCKSCKLSGEISNRAKSNDFSSVHNVHVYS